MLGTVEVFTQTAFIIIHSHERAPLGQIPVDKLLPGTFLSSASASGDIRLSMECPKPHKAVD